MSMLELVAMIATVAAVAGSLTRRWLRLPFTVGTMLVTVLASMGLLAAAERWPVIDQWATGLVSQLHFEHLILEGLLPFLLFAGAYLLDVEELGRQWRPVALLAGLGTVLCCGLVAACVHGLTGVGWIECMLLGAVLSPTDPIAVLEMLGRSGVKREIRAQLAGESLFNDGMGAVLFVAVLEVARGQAPTTGAVVWLLLLKAGGGALLGAAAAWLAAQWMRPHRAGQVELLATLALAAGGYAVAEQLGVSAPMEAVVAGLALRLLLRRKRAEAELLQRFWELADGVLNVVLFVLMGLEVLAIALNRQVLAAGAVAIASVLVVRLLVVGGLLGVLRRVDRKMESSVAILSWGGLRGGLSLALALAVPGELSGSWIVGATYCVVVFSLLVQGATMERLLRWQRGRARG